MCENSCQIGILYQTLEVNIVLKGGHILSLEVMRLPMGHSSCITEPGFEPRFF